MSAVSDKLRELSYEPLSGAAGISSFDDEMLQKLPELIGSPLPDDYLQFFTEFRSTGSLFADVDGLERAPWARDAIYPICVLFASSPTPGQDLLGLRKFFEKEEWLIQDVRSGKLTPEALPRHLLCIGEDIFGDHICLDLRKESFGKIYFWCHKEPLGTGLSLVANDFTSFINSMRPGEESGETGTGSGRAEPFLSRLWARIWQHR
jgi:hypothetical protein